MPDVPMSDDLLLRYLMQQGGANQANQGIAKKQALINQLRQTSQMPGMIQGGGARTVKAAHPLSALADIVGTGLGDYQQRGLDEQSNKIMGDSRSQLADLSTNMNDIARVKKAQKAGLIGPNGEDLTAQPQPMLPGMNSYTE